jgi:hypothetical protein
MEGETYSLEKEKWLITWIEGMPFKLITKKMPFQIAILVGLLKKYPDYFACKILYISMAHSNDLLLANDQLFSKCLLLMAKTYKNEAISDSNSNSLIKNLLAEYNYKENMRKKVFSVVNYLSD